MSEWLRWKLWHWLCKLPGVCPANAHTTVIYGDLRCSPRVSDLCRGDFERNGSCWCGKLRADSVCRHTARSTT